MKSKIIFLLAGIMLLVLTQGCVRIGSNINGFDFDDQYNSIVGSGKLITLTLGFRDFSHIYLHHAVKATIKKSDRFSIVLEIDDNLSGYLETSQAGNRITIGLKNGFSYKNTTIRAVIETPDVELLNLSGASSIELDQFNLANELFFDASGASVIKGNFNAQKINMQLSGASVVEFYGTGNELKVNGSGASVLNLLGYQLKKCDLNLSGASSSNIYVTEKLDVTLSGGSVLRYKGNPAIGIMNTSGGSVIQRLN